MSTNHLPLMAMGLGGAAASPLLARKQADVAVGAPKTPPLLALDDDTVMQIVLWAADVFNSLQYATTVLATKYFSQDGYGAIERLCMSLQTMNNWCTVHSQACYNNRDMFNATKRSITAKLREFINKVNYWRVELPHGLANAEMNKRMADMCDHLNELYANAQSMPPMLSRQRGVTPFRG
jgi:hypothetical protein